MTTPTPRWTAETVDLVARALYRFAVEPLTDDAFDEEDDQVKDACRSGARQFLTALADAGALTAVGGETRQEWGVADVVDHDEEIWPVESEDRARAKATRLGVKPYCRTITTHVGPWREVTE